MATKNINFNEIQQGIYFDGKINWIKETGTYPNIKAFAEILPIGNYSLTALYNYIGSNSTTYNVWAITINCNKTSSTNYTIGLIIDDEGDFGYLYNLSFNSNNNSYSVDTTTTDRFYGTFSDITYNSSISSVNAQEIFTSPEFSNLLKVQVKTNGLYSMLDRITTKIRYLNLKLDYYLNVISQCLSIEHTITPNVTGVTVAASAVRLIGNDLNISIRLSLTSAAQTTIGTGNITNTDLCTITIDDFLHTTGGTYVDESLNLSHINAVPKEVCMSSGYSSGNACPAAFHCVMSSSNTTLTIVCRIDALYAKTSEFRFVADIPVSRCQSRYHYKVTEEW